MSGDKGSTGQDKGDAATGLYESVLLSLEDMAQTDASNTGVTARGLLERFGK
ncbi:hypothetical protein JOQ06_023857, partial [Pogonophryne albipinna]